MEGEWADAAAGRSSGGGGRPAPAEAWRLLRQTGLPRKKVRHSRLVAAGAWRLSLALAETGLSADPELSLLGGILHDLAHREDRHAHAARLWCEALGWPEVALVVGAHTDPPEAFLARIGCGPALESAPAGEEYARASETVVWCGLAVYLADKYWGGDQPVNLRQRFQSMWTRFGPQSAAREIADQRQAVALAVEDWFRRRLGREPEAIVRAESPEPGAA